MTIYKLGDSVIVKAQVIDPDFDTDLGGWQGRISEVVDEGGLLRIDWDSQTLKEMPDEFIAQCEEVGMVWQQMFLESAEVELTIARDQIADVQVVCKERQDQHAFDYLGEEGKGISQVLKGIDPEDDSAIFAQWDDHLGDTLSFPFKARVAEFQERGALKMGQTVWVQAITDIDDLYGLLAKVKCDRSTLTFPLCDLEAVDSNSVNYPTLRNYVVWFANR